MKKILKKVSIPNQIKLPNKYIKLAITGLSRSGKTIFIISLINQLLHDLNLKKKFKRNFIVSIIPNRELEQFKYYNFLDNLTQKKPIWPQSTDNITAITLRLEIQSRKKFIKNRIIDIEIIDYPGEWLLDIDMLNKDYEQWSDGVFNLITNEPRKTLAKEWLEYLESIDLSTDIDESIQKELVNQYTKFLHKCNENNLSLIQPGRFIMPGYLEGSEVLKFCPLPKSETLNKNSYYFIFKERYENYVKEYVRDFHLNHFVKFDRQIILVDVLKALKNGYEPFEDMVKAMKIIMSIYSYGKLNFLTKFFKTQIDRVIFCATKADHVANNQHNNYKSLLEMIVKEAKSEIDIKGVQTISSIISSVKSTQSLVKLHDGRRLSCLKGKVLAQEEEVIVYPGEVPEYFPNRADWDTDYFDFPNFAPIAFPTNKAVDNIRMDEVIYHLIGDKI